MGLVKRSIDKADCEVSPPCSFRFIVSLMFLRTVFHVLVIIIIIIIISIAVLSKS